MHMAGTYWLKYLIIYRSPHRHQPAGFGPPLKRALSTTMVSISLRITFLINIPTTPHTCCTNKTSPRCFKHPDPRVHRGTRPQELCFEPDPPSPAPSPPPVCSHPTYRKEHAPCSPKFVLLHCPAPFCARGWDRGGHRGPHTTSSLSHIVFTQKGLSSSFFLIYSLRHPPFLSTCTMTNVTPHPSQVLNINPLNPMWEPAGEWLPIRTASYMDRNFCTRPSFYKTKDTSKAHYKQEQKDSPILARYTN